jgi:GDPmannose 4,6-dehydratase
VFISGSALQFKNDAKPINETAPFQARDAYSVSRIQSVYAARYFRTLGVQTYIGYFFNHDSPLRSERHMSMKIAAAAHRIASGSRETLTIGNIQVAKEWTFAGDTVAAVWTLMQQDAVSESVIGSGLAYTIEDWLEACFSYARLNWRAHIVMEENFVPDYQRLVSDPATLHQLGWHPAVSFSELAAMMIQSLQ